MWAHSKRDLIRGGKRKWHMYGYLASFMLKRQLVSHQHPILSFIDLANEWGISDLPVGNHSLLVPGPVPHLDDSGSESSSESDDEFALSQQVTAFAETTSHQLEFLVYFTSNDRRIIHVAAERHGLNHTSIGSGSERRIIHCRSNIPTDVDIPIDSPVSLAIDDSSSLPSIPVSPLPQPPLAIAFDNETPSHRALIVSHEIELVVLQNPRADTHNVRIDVVTKVHIKFL